MLYPAVPPRWLLLLTVSLLGGCHSSQAQPGEIGSACRSGGNCKSGTCVTDLGLPDNYCSRECSEDGTCPDNASCEDYQGSKICMLACDDDAACRTGYVCDYGVCRPSCADDDNLCRGTDLCSMQHCRAPCKNDQGCPDGSRCARGRCFQSCDDDRECPADKLCQGGTCLPPCDDDTGCLPGFTCNTGSRHCEEKEGKKLGAVCAASAECATDYCLPTRKVCSVKCSASSGCPAGWVCGLEKVDADKNGRFEQAEADCIPVKGSGLAGSLCEKGDDCASEHCYDGFCLEGCAGDGDCGKLQCVPVNVILDGGAPGYKGCLPREAVGGKFTVGTFDGHGSYQSVDIPPNAQSFVLSAQVDSTSYMEVPVISRLKDPLGVELNSAWAYDICGAYSAPLRFMSAEQYTSVYLPNTPTVTIKPGRYTFTVASTEVSKTVKITLQLKLGQANKGTLNINWFFLNLTPGGWNFCIPGDRLSAANAATHPWFTKVRNNMAAIFKTAGVGIGKETYQDLDAPALDAIAIGSDELLQLFASSKSMTGNAVNVFVVRSIDEQSMGGIILGIAGDIPGPIGVHGLVHSGIALSSMTACFESFGVSTGQVLAHELGHYLGLYHNLESEEYPGYVEAIGTQPATILCPCPCGSNLVCQKGSGKSWCRGLDPLPDTDSSPQNLMYFSADSSQDFQGNTLTPSQIRVILDNPLVGHQ